MALLFFPLGLGLALASGSVTFRALRGRHVALRLVCALGAAWTAAGTLCAGGLAVFLVALSEPWPLSLRQGPDTRFARSRFEVHFREPPPDSVGEVYCREEWGFGGDSIHSLRFTFSEPGVVERLIERLGLEPVPDAERASLRVLAAPGRWPSAAELRNSSEAYQRSGVDCLWIDREAGQAFFQQANF